MLVEILEKTAKEVAKNIGKSAAIGGVLDGAIAAVDKKSMIKEIGCGVVTSGIGTASKEAFEYFTKNTGKWGTVVGVSSSVLARYLYRSHLCDEGTKDSEK